MADGGGTERASAQRRARARRHGQVPISSEIGPVAVLLIAAGVASWGAPVLIDRSQRVLVQWLAAVGPIAAHGDPVAPLAWSSAIMLGGVLGPYFLVVAAIGLGAVVAQVGWSVHPALLVPDPRRLAVATGRARAGSLAIAKILVVGGVGWHVLASVGVTALDASALPVESILGVAGASLRELVLALAVALAAVAAADYLWARRQHERRLAMSRGELRDEQRTHEGDPALRRRVRRAWRERVAAGRGAVRTADLVLVDPGQVAVALRYRSEETSAPRVVAKGARLLARRLEDEARGAGIAILERRALARALMRSVPIGGETPPAVYRAVAEALAHLYAGRGMPPGEAVR